MHIRLTLAAVQQCMSKHGTLQVNGTGSSGGQTGPFNTTIASEARAGARCFGCCGPSSFHPSRLTDD